MLRLCRGRNHGQKAVLAAMSAFDGRVTFATLRDMRKRWPTQRIALLCGAPLGFFSELLLVNWDDSSIYNVVGECLGGAVVGVLLVGAICAGRNLILRAK